jgi:WbqC-like protein family
MVVAIHQPNFLPWLGYFHKLLNSDVFVLFDDVQFPRAKTVVNRVLIKTQQGPTWISIPVPHKGDLASIREVRIAPDPSWKRKLLRTVELSYAKAPFTKQYLPGIRQIIESASDELWRLNSALIAWCAQQLGAETQLVYSSSLCKDQPPTKGSEKIHNLLKATGATVYISGETVGSHRYVEEEWFRQQGIQLQWQHFQHPRYPQLHGAFAEYLSIIDLIFNCGPQARSILLSR